MTDPERSIEKLDEIASHIQRTINMLHGLGEYDMNVEHCAARLTESIMWAKMIKLTYTRRMDEERGGQ